MSNRTVQITYGISDDDNCKKSAILEVPEQNLAPNDTITLKLWGESSEITDYSLWEGTDTLGSGIWGTDPVSEVVESIDFAESDQAQLSYPVTELVSVVSQIESFYEEDDDIIIWATRGANVTDRSSIVGKSCIALDEVIYGLLNVTYNRITSYKSWEWMVPADESGDHWFFLKKAGEITHKFSLEVPGELVVTGPKTIKIYAKDNESHVMIPNATLFLDGVDVGVTNVNGNIIVENVSVGTHTVKFTATGYTDTNNDGLDNDEITVI